MNKGAMERITHALAATMTPRCAMLQVSMRVYQKSRSLKTKDSLEECWVRPDVAATIWGGLMKREQSIGVRGKETRRETATGKPVAAIRPKAEMMEVGIAMAAIRVVRMLARKRKMMMAAKKLPSTRWCLILSTAALMKTD